MLPADAEWIEDLGEHRVCPKVEGRLHGESRTFRPDGTLASVSRYVDGREQGAYERFHPDGTVSQRGDQVDDKPHGLVSWYRPEGVSPEASVPAVCPPVVREMRARFEHGVPWPVRFYLADGTECLPNGEPLPERPASVDPEAAFDAEGRRWYLGLGSQSHAQRHGRWQWWSEAGERVIEKRYHRGTEREEVTWDGVVRTRRVKGPREVLLTERFVDGVAVDAHGEPPPAPAATVPEEARYDVSSGNHVHGPHLEETDSDDETAPAEGIYTTFGPTGARVHEVVFAAGVRVSQRTHYDSGALMRETLYDRSGNELCESWFDSDGELTSRIERTWDGAAPRTVHILTAGEGERAVGIASGEGMRWTFREAGVVTAEGTVAAHRAVGRWTFTEGARRWELDLDGLHANVDEDFRPQWLLGAALLDQESQGERIPELAGVDAVDWASIQGAYRNNVVRFPALLQAMTSPIEAVRHTAIGRISSEIEHQGSIYPATAAVIPFLLRLLAHPNVDTGEILSQVLYAAQLAAEDDDDFEDDDFEDEEDDLDEEDEEDEDEDEDEDEEDEEGDHDYAAYARVPGDILRAVEEGFDRIAACLHDERDRVLSLARYGGVAGVRLLRDAAAGPDPELAAIAVHGLVAAPDTDRDQVVAWLTHPDPLVRLCTALAAAHRHGPDAPGEAVQELTAALDADGTLCGRFYALPFTEGRVIANVSVALALIRSPDAMALAGRLAERLEGQDLFTLDSLTAALLKLSFGDGEPPFAPAFVDVIERLARCRALTGFANFGGTARQWNLPSDLDGLHTLGRALREHPDPVARMRAQLVGS